MTNKIVKLVEDVVAVKDDTFNPETYFNRNVSWDDGYLSAQYVLGNLYTKGRDYKVNKNFEIFKDHSTWQVWVWHFDESKDETRNSFNCPYYKTDKLIEFIQNVFGM